jgi:hypothetical protein
VLIELSILVFGLLASYLFLRLVYPDQEITKLLVSTVSIFMCFMILFGYYLNRFGLPLFSMYLLIIFSPLVVVLITWILLTSHLLSPSMKTDKKVHTWLYILTICYKLYEL